MSVQTVPAPCTVKRWSGSMLWSCCMESHMDTPTQHYFVRIK